MIQKIRDLIYAPRNKKEILIQAMLDTIEELEQDESDEDEEPTIEDLKIAVFTNEDFKQIQEYRFRRR